MAEILVKAQDSLAPDQCFQWKQGDVVCAMPDGHPWGAKERDPSRFKIVKIALPEAEIQKYMETWTNQDGSMYRRRLWKWDAVKGMINKQSKNVERISTR